MQPQGHMQVISRLVDEQLDPQAALDAPRFNLRDAFAEGPVLLEDTAGSEVAEALGAKGHDVKVLRGMDKGAMGLGAGYSEV